MQNVNKSPVHHSGLPSQCNISHFRPQVYKRMQVFVSFYLVAGNLQHDSTCRIAREARARRKDSPRSPGAIDSASHQILHSNQRRTVSQAGPVAASQDRGAAQQVKVISKDTSLQTRRICKTCRVSAQPALWSF